MSQGSLRPRFTYNVAKSVVREEEVSKHLEAEDWAYLLLCAVHITRDASLLERYGRKVGSPAILQVSHEIGDPAGPGAGPGRVTGGARGALGQKSTQLPWRYCAGLPEPVRQPRA
jgi:hypothetical protein